MHEWIFFDLLFARPVLLPLPSSESKCSAATEIVQSVLATETKAKRVEMKLLVQTCKHTKSTEFTELRDSPCPERASSEYSQQHGHGKQAASLLLLMKTLLPLQLPEGFQIHQAVERIKQSQTHPLTGVRYLYQLLPTVTTVTGVLKLNFFWLFIFIVFCGLESFLSCQSD